MWQHGGTRPLFEGRRDVRPRPHGAATDAGGDYAYRDKWVAAIAHAAAIRSTQPHPWQSDRAGSGERVFVVRAH
jgi:hypothetical protein